MRLILAKNVVVALLANATGVGGLSPDGRGVMEAVVTIPNQYLSQVLLEGLLPLLTCTHVAASGAAATPCMHAWKATNAAGHAGMHACAGRPTSMWDMQWLLVSTGASSAGGGHARAGAAVCHRHQRVWKVGVMFRASPLPCS